LSGRGSTLPGTTEATVREYTVRPLGADTWDNGTRSLFERAGFRHDRPKGQAPQRDDQDGPAG